MPFAGTAEVTYTKNGNEYIDIVNDDIMDGVIEHATNHLRVQHPNLNIASISYESSEPDTIVEIVSDNPQEPIQIPQLSIQTDGDTYVATFGLLEFTEENNNNNNQNGGRRRRKSRSRRLHKTSKRKLQRKRNLKRKTHHCKNRK